MEKKEMKRLIDIECDHGEIMGDILPNWVEVDPADITISCAVAKDADGNNKSVTYQFYYKEETRPIASITSTAKAALENPEVLLKGETSNIARYGDEFNDMFDGTYVYIHIRTLGGKRISIEHHYGNPGSEEIFLRFDPDNKNGISVFSDNVIKLTSKDRVSPYKYCFDGNMFNVEFFAPNNEGELQ